MCLHSFFALHVTELSLKKEQCRESCRATISKHGYSIIGPKSSPSLSSSAVSAMLSLREGDESYLDSFQLQDMTDQGYYFSTRKNAADSVDEFDDLIEKSMKSRPVRLPPLIEKLIGTLDGEYPVMKTLHKSSGTQSKLIRRVDSHDRAIRLGEITKQGLKEISNGDDSVAMVAAAAAAAVLSNTDANRGNMRMKNVNSEWEEALRWIASWGQNSHDSEGDTNNESDWSSERRNANRKNRKRRIPRINKRRHMETENEIDFELFLDVCIDRCISNKGDERSLRYRDGEPIDMMTNIRSTLGPNHLFSLIMSIVHDIKPKSILSSRTFRQGLRNVFGLILSTAVIWFIRNINDWRKMNQYVNSLRSLLEEESREARTSNGGAKCRNSNVKKSKKNLRKKKLINTRLKDQTHTSLSNDDNNESDISDDSTEGSVVEEEEEYPRNNSEDQGSKECNTTVSSCTTDVEYKYRMMSTDATILKLKASNQEKRSKSQVSLKKIDYDSYSRNNQKTRNYVPSKKNDVNVYNKRSKEGQVKDIGSKHQLHGTSSDFVPSTPTTAQREAAAQKLRAFQQAQIQKLIASKKVHTVSNQPQVNSPGRHPMLRDLYQNHSDEILVTQYANNGISPPPGLTKLSREDEINAIKKDENEADAGYLLSLLEDEEEYVEHKFTTSTNENYYRQYNNTYEQPRSVALGDLLVGSYSTSQNSQLNLSSNPWTKEESIEGSLSTAETLASSQSHNSIQNNTSHLGAQNKIYDSNDANISLQVSAMAFSPSDTVDKRAW